MVDNRLTSIINNRTCFVYAHGSSLSEIEEKIVQYKNNDICHCSLNYFSLIEDHILSKINKHLDIVYDSSTVAPSFQSSFDNVRIPRLQTFLNRKENNLFISTKGLMQRDIYISGYTKFYEINKDKILLVDDFKINLNVPNSLTLLIASLVLGGASKILLFGCDGYRGNQESNINSFYKPELQAKERLIAVGNTSNSDIILDTNNFELKFWEKILQYCEQYGIVCPPIYNCSSKSIYNHIKKIDVTQIMEN